MPLVVALYSDTPTNWKDFSVEDLSVNMSLAYIPSQTPVLHPHSKVFDFSGLKTPPLQSFFLTSLNLISEDDQVGAPSVDFSGESLGRVSNGKVGPVEDALLVHLHLGNVIVASLLVAGEDIFRSLLKVYRDHRWIVAFMELKSVGATQKSAGQNKR